MRRCVGLALAGVLALSVAGHVACGRDAEAGKVLLQSGAFSDARCLDGTPGAFYVNRNPKNDTWIIYLNGGGECVDAQSCQYRATTELGSSSLMPDSLWFNYGLLDTDESRNPFFSEANMVRVGYCSGDLHLGSRTSKTQDDLFLQGRLIVRAVIDTLFSHYGMSDASLVIFGGESAGGIGSLALMDEVKGLVAAKNAQAKVVGSIQGGYYFLNDMTYNGTDPPPGNFIPWGTDSFPKYIDFWGATLPRECTSRQPYGEHWRCIVADYSFEHVATPVFVAEALTDKTVIPLHTGVPAQDPKQFTQEEAAFVHRWSRVMSGSIGEHVMREGNTKDGLFAIACWTHTSFEEGRLIRGLTHLQAMHEWVLLALNGNRDGTAVQLLDPCGTFLCNPTCPPQ